MCTHRHIRFVSVHWCILIWVERWLSASRVEGAWSRERDSQSDLHIQVGLDPSPTLFVQAAFTLEGIIELITSAIVSGRKNKGKYHTPSISTALKDVLTAAGTWSA